MRQGKLWWSFSIFLVLVSVPPLACTRPPAPVQGEMAVDAVHSDPVAPVAVDDGLPAGAIHQFSGGGEVRLDERAEAPVLLVEVARTPAEREQGLMYRRHLADGHGMLFFMPELRTWNFWMRNTLIPLDIIFVGEDWRVVGVAERAVPLTETGRGVPIPSRYVLELGAGQAEFLHIATGTHLQFRATMGSAAAGRVGAP